MKKIISFLAFLLTLGYSKLALAAEGGSPITIEGVNKGGAEEVSQLIATLINYMIGIAGLVSLVYIIIGGFNYITSSGNADKIKTAQKTITYAIIGLMVVVLAFAIRSFVFDRLGIGDPGTTQKI